MVFNNPNNSNHKTNIIILGANGMAGHVISKFLFDTNNYNILNIVKKNINNISNDLLNNKTNNILELNLQDQTKLESIIKDFKPNYIINAAGSLIKESETTPHTAIYANSFLPKYLDYLSGIYNFKLIHLSTNCVFSGKKNASYTEEDSPDADYLYGKSKALGEINNNKNLTIRTSFIGPELKPSGEGLLHWFLNQSGNIDGFSRAIWAGVTTLELAKFINLLIINNYNLTGIYHLSNNEPINKYSLLSLIKNIFNIHHININKKSEYYSDKSFITSRQDINYLKINSYETMLLELREFMKTNKNLYPHYMLDF